MIFRIEIEGYASELFVFSTHMITLPARVEFYPNFFNDKRTLLDEKRFPITHSKMEADTGVSWKNNGGLRRFVEK